MRPRRPPWARHPRSERPARREARLTTDRQIAHLHADADSTLRFASRLLARVDSCQQGSDEALAERLQRCQGALPERGESRESGEQAEEADRGGTRGFRRRCDAEATLTLQLTKRNSPSPAAPSASAPPAQTRHDKSSRVPWQCMPSACARAADTSLVGAPVSSRERAN